MNNKPVVFLAFANEQDGHRYLRDLPEELRRLQKILEGAEKEGLCKLVIRPNATLEEILETFREHRDRVSIFHYGGHAGDNRLFLETKGAEGAVAHAEGLARFLSQRRNLQLVFLNGCSTRAQAAGLADAGVAAVIATARAIEDAVALEFATAFYAELASGQTLRAAYEAARGGVMAGQGTAPQAYVRTRDLGVSDQASTDPADERGFPWELRLAPGAELVGRWSLPEAADDPLFGLPKPSVDWLPESPYRGLQRFTRDEAAVFFGRGRAIRELYNLVLDPGARPVILYYGPTGVGKSSVLDAGLAPRLEHSREVLYLRRDPELGLLGALGSGLALDKLAVNPGPSLDLARLWLDREHPDRPLVVILDQAEEVFTRPRIAPSAPGNEAQRIDPDAELAELLAALRATFAGPDPSQRSKGKLIVSFRSEWLDRFEQAFNAVRLGWEPMPLKPLERRGVIEAIEGPASEPALHRRYELTIADGLAPMIADDLVIDAGSALAPTLQVLLTNMWREAGGKGSHFDLDMYRRLRAGGYLLRDVIEEGLKAVRLWREEVESSGLALDLLAYHVTDFDAAAQRTRAELMARYPQRADLLPGLLETLKDGYLLLETDARSEPSAPPIPATRLAHDTLAPLVHERFRTSMAPGQRARRLLENRAPEWHDGKMGPVLDAADLSAVETGAAGMRAWTTDEARLVEASRQAEERRLLEEEERQQRARWNQRFRWAAAAALFVSLLGVGIALKVANQRQILAELQERLAQAASFTRTAFSEVNTNPELAALYGIHAIRLSGEDQEQSGFAEQILRHALSAIPTITLRSESRYGDGADQRNSDSVNTISFAQSERMLAFGTLSGRVYVRQLGNDPSNTPLKIVSSEPIEWKKFFSTRFARIASVAFAFGDRWLIVQEAGKGNNKVRVFDTNTSFEEIAVPPEWQTADVLNISPNGETVVMLGDSGRALTFWYGNAQTPPKKGPTIHPSTVVNNVSFTADGRNLLLQHDMFNFTLVTSDGTITRKINLPSELPFLKEESGYSGTREDYFARISPDASYLISTRRVFSDRTQPQRLGAIWDISGNPARQMRLFTDRKHALADADFSADGRWLALGHDDKTMLWDLTKVSPQAEPTGVIKSGDLVSISLDRNSKWVAIADYLGTVRLSDLSRLETIDQPVVVTALGEYSLRFSGSGFWLAAGDYNGTVKVCDVSRDCTAAEGGSMQPSEQVIVGCSGLSGVWTVSLISGSSVEVSLDRGRRLPRRSIRLPWSSTGNKQDRWGVRSTCSPDNHWMFIYGDTPANRYLFDLSAENPTNPAISITSYPEKIDSAQFDNTSKWLIAGSEKGMYSANFSDPSYIQFKPLAGYKGGEVNFSPKGQWLIEGVPFTYPEDPTLVPLLRKVQATEIGDPIRLSVSIAPRADLVFSADDKWLFASERLEPSQGEFEATGPAVNSYLWDLQAVDKSPPIILPGHRQEAGAVFSPDGSWIATVDATSQQRQKVVQLWHIEKEIRRVMGFEMEAPAQVLYPTFDPNSRWFILGKGITAAFYDLTKIAGNKSLDPDPTFELPSGTSITAHWDLRFSPDGQWFINQGRQEPLRVWWWSKGDDAQLVSDVPEQQGEANVAFIGDKAVTSIPSDSESDAKTSTILWTFKNSSRTVKRVSLSGGGEILVHPDQQTITLLSKRKRTWTLSTATLISLAERLIGRNLTLSEWSRVSPGKPYEKAFPELPEDASVVRGYVESAQANAEKGDQEAANRWYKLAVNSVLDSRNPFLALRVAESGLANNATEVVAAAAELAVKLDPSDPRAFRARGLARVRLGDQSGIEDVQKYIRWASEHGASSNDLKMENDAIQDQKRLMHQTRAPG